MLRLITSAPQTSSAIPSSNCTAMTRSCSFTATFIPKDDSIESTSKLSTMLVPRTPLHRSTYLLKPTESLTRYSAPGSVNVAPSTQATRLVMLFLTQPEMVMSFWSNYCYLFIRNWQVWDRKSRISQNFQLTTICTLMQLQYSSVRNCKTWATSSTMTSKFLPCFYSISMMIATTKL